MQQRMIHAFFGNKPNQRNDATHRQSRNQSCKKCDRHFLTQTTQFGNVQRASLMVNRTCHHKQATLKQ